MALRSPDVICQTRTPAAPGADATAVVYLILQVLQDELTAWTTLQERVRLAENAKQAEASKTELTVVFVGEQNEDNSGSHIELPMASRAMGWLLLDPDGADLHVARPLEA
jgi:hypothetical protein